LSAAAEVPIIATMSLRGDGKPQVQPHRSRPGGRGFHADAFGLWLAGESFTKIAKECQVNPWTINEWAKREDWHGMLERIEARARTRVIEHEGNRLARIAERHIAQARAFQEVIEKLLTEGVPMINPETGKPYVEKGKEAKRDLLPMELNQLVHALVRAAELEYVRAGGGARAAPPHAVLPQDLTDLLDRMGRPRVQAAIQPSASP
jgi:hypothetical protein